MSVELFSKAAEIAKEVGPKMSEGFEKIKPEKEMSVKDISKGVKEEFDKAKAEKPSEMQDVKRSNEAQESSGRDIGEKIEKHPCINEDLAGKVHPETKVPYEKKVVTADGVQKEVVGPRFESKYDANLPKEIYKETDRKQFKECNKQLSEAVEKDPDLKAKFSDEQLEQIKNGDTPDGFVWHHDVEPGKMQLVDAGVHQKTPHTGGRSIWGGGSKYR